MTEQPQPTNQQTPANSERDLGGGSTAQNRVYVKPPSRLKEMTNEEIRAWTRALHAGLMEQMDPDGSKRAAARQAAADTSET